MIKMTDTESKRDFRKEWESDDGDEVWEDSGIQGEPERNDKWVEELLAHCEGLEKDNENYRKRIIKVVEQRDRMEPILAGKEREIKRLEDIANALQVSYDAHTKERDSYKEQLEQAQSDFEYYKSIEKSTVTYADNIIHKVGELEKELELTKVQSNDYERMYFLKKEELEAHKKVIGEFETHPMYSDAQLKHKNRILKELKAKHLKESE